MSNIFDIKLDRKLFPLRNGKRKWTDIDFIVVIADAGNEEMLAVDGERAETSSSRLPHNRITAWARELMDDLQSIEDADQTSNSNKDEDLGDNLAVKRYKHSLRIFPNLDFIYLFLIGLAD